MSFWRGSWSEWGAPRARAIAMLSVAAAGGTVTGDANITLGGLTSSADGTVIVAGASSPTLGALTSTADGTVLVTGTTNATLGALTVSAAGTTANTGSATITLGSITTAADGNLVFYGQGNGAKVDKVKVKVGEPSNAANVGQSDFTIECWIRPAVSQSTTGSGVTAGANYSWIEGSIFIDRDLLGSVGGGGDWGASLTDAGLLAFGVENSGGSQRTIVGTTDLRDAAWHHIAIQRQRSSGDLSIYVDGAREAFQASGPSGDVHYDDALTPGANTENPYLCFGGEKHDITWAGQYAGGMDEIRVSTSLRYSGTTYEVPVNPFVADASTVLLYHCDEPSGTTLTDTSGNGLDATLYVGGASNGPTREFSGGAIGTVLVTGSSTPTLGALTTSAAGTVLVSGSASPTLGALTTSAAGTVLVVGTSTATLGTLTTTADGTVLVVGTTNTTLGALTIDAQGVVGVAPIEGALTQTLGALTASAAGTVLVSGTSTPTLGSLTVSAAGTVLVSGETGATLGTLTSSAVGAVTVSGTTSGTLGSLSTTADGTVLVTGTLTQTLGVLAVGDPPAWDAASGPYRATRVTGIGRATRSTGLGKAIRT